MGDSLKKRSYRKGIIITSIIFISIIGLAIFLFLFFYVRTISDNEFSQGINFQLNEGKYVKFNFDNHIHKLKVDSVYGNSIRLIIQSNTIRTEIEIGEELKFDLDEDDFYDIQLKLNKITNGVPEIYLKEIHESTCVENWECDDWSKCYEEGIQIRVCTDSNNCGTIKEKPSTIKDCVYNCIEDWDCSDWSECENGEQTRDCEDMNDCGTTEDKPHEHRTCTIPIIDCGHSYLPGDNSDYDCFIEASENCELSKLLSTGTLELFRVIITGTTRMELKGIEDGKCIYYQITESYSIKYSDELIQSLLDSDLTQAEIDEQEQIANENAQELVGLTQTCKFEQEDLTAMLTRWKQGNASGGATCTLNQDEWDCTYTGDFENAECEAIFS